MEYTKQQLVALSNNRATAESILKVHFGHDHFYDEQWYAIQKLLKGERILLIERTGFGKSLCFQFPAFLFSGLTVIFSPLIALMRDQVRSLNHCGIPAACLNSEQDEETNNKAIEDAKAGKLKILYIAPERQENQTWIEATRTMNLSMVVIDEAHTVSVWGHDFRPAFRRIINLVYLLPKDMPVLAVTATATERVQKDIEQQVGSGIKTIRGNLLRNNLNLRVIKTTSEDEKLLWLGQHINELPGTGLIYTGTRVNTEIYAQWLQFLGIKAICYNASLDAETRKEIENGLLTNKWKVVVSTNALGMGIDKPDVRFIIHTQIPASPIHYYQEIGRAGRDGDNSEIILFYNESADEEGEATDIKLPKSFIENAKPSKKNYQKVIDLLKNEALGERQIIIRSNLKQNQVRVIKADLIDQNIIREVVVGKSKKYEYQYSAPELDISKFEALRAAKFKDLEKMVEYINTTEPRMKFLCSYLGDNLDHSFSRCDNTDLPKFHYERNSSMESKLQDFRETYFPTLEVEEKNSNIVNGVAGSYYGISNVGMAMHRCKYENGGDFPDFLIRLTLKAYRKHFGNKNPDLVLFVPPTLSGKLVENFARKVASVLNVPISTGLVKIKNTKAQKIFHNGYSKRDNVADAFDIKDNVSGKCVMIIDDIFDSGATLKEIGKLLTKKGAATIIPLVIAKTVGND